MMLLKIFLQKFSFNGFINFGLVGLPNPIKTPSIAPLMTNFTNNGTLYVSVDIFSQFERVSQIIESEFGTRLHDGFLLTITWYKFPLLHDQSLNVSVYYVLYISPLSNDFSLPSTFLPPPPHPLTSSLSLPSFLFLSFSLIFLPRSLPPSSVLSFSLSLSPLFSPPSSSVLLPLFHSLSLLSSHLNSPFHFFSLSFSFMFLPPFPLCPPSSPHPLSSILPFYLLLPSIPLSSSHAVYISTCTGIRIYGTRMYGNICYTHI